MHKYLKVLTGIGVAGSIGGGGYAVSTLLTSNNEIADKLVKESYTILTNETQDSTKHWQAILNNYKTIAESNPKLKFDNFTGKETNLKPEEELARLCHELLKPNTSLNTKDEDNYKKAEKWCVVPVTVLDILKKKGHNALSTATGDVDKAKWTDKVKGLKSSTEKINGLTLDTDKETAKDQEIRDIKQKCAEIGSKKNHDDKYEDNLNLFTNWCSNKNKSE